MDDPFQMIAGFPFMFIFGIQFIAGLVSGSTDNGVTFQLTTGDDRNVIMGTRNVCLTSFFVLSFLFHAAAFLWG